MPFRNDELDTCNGKVLFVDDEINILKSIRRGFLNSYFDVFTAQSAKEGIHILDNEAIDIVVTDYKMPCMDGLQFLKLVREKYPKINRVILSGYIEKSVAVESLTRGLASTYILKPWLNEEIEQKILHILAIRKMLKSKKLLNIINRITNLPTLSNIFREFMEAVNDDKSMKEISKIIQKDPTVATKVLQIANSAFYGKKNCTSIDQAAVTLGLDTLQDVFLTLAVINSMKWTREQIRSLQNIFLHSFIMNHWLPVLHKLMPDATNYKSFPSVGLTYDIGKIILLQYFPDRFKLIIHNCSEFPQMEFHKSELQLGYEDCSHQEIGAYFLDYWNFPEVFIETALFHHNPEKSSTQYRDIVEVTHYVDQLIHYLNATKDQDDIDLSDFQSDFITETTMRDMAQNIKKRLDERFTSLL